MWKMLQELEPELKLDRQSKQWRVGLTYFQGVPDHLVKLGVVNMAPAWFEQGHNVCENKYSTSNKGQWLILLQTEQFPLKVSKLLVLYDGPASHWLSLMVESSAIIGGILIIVQALYEARKEAITYLNQHPQMVDQSAQLKQLLQVWSAPFHGLSVISN